MSVKKSVKSTVSDHPEIIGVLFALMFLLSQAGTVAAASQSYVTGP